MVSRSCAMRFILCVFCLSAAPVWGDGHGPAFGYSTATLGLGDKSVETELMWRSGVAMISPRLSYGVRENLQLSISAPFHLNHGEHPVGRFTGLATLGETRRCPRVPGAAVTAVTTYPHCCRHPMRAVSSFCQIQGGRESSRAPHFFVLTGV